ncbi:MAG: cysteine--tRNA ligase [Bacteroidetes bacterium]|nr:MAG: cysteine--tRNA ligase [Bacteroidota bacterium]
MRIPHQAEGFIPALKVYNTLTREKVDFEPINPPFVGIYLCGPTVYNLAHIGNARPAVFFDVVRRYLTYLGLKVRFVRNITDVGHLTGDSDEGEDKISKQAKLEQIEPMEIVNFYTQKYHQVIDKLNVLRPSIEPTATGHIVEQIELVQKILDIGLAYVSDGSVYFDVNKYRMKENYGELSGRILEELLETTRELEGQKEKKNSADFALWKKANPEHLMRWNSPWGEGFPGWHLECTAMSTKYLGKSFDIHGGGLDLMFPHHECEIAQAKAAYGEAPVKYWMHNNMVTINGTKMGKSLGNFITIEDLFSGKNELLERSYSPMTVRFFILQAHYRSTLDFSNDALLAAQKAYKRLINALMIVKKLAYPLHPKSEIDEQNDEQIQGFCDTMLKGMQDDFNTAIAIGQLSNIVKKINSFYINPETIDTIKQGTFERMKSLYQTMIEDILGLEEEKSDNQEAFLRALLDLYAEAKEKKEYATVDKIRASFKNNNLIIKDLKNGVDWAYQE